MEQGRACRLCGKIIGGNAGSMARHQSTWQCAAGRQQHAKRRDHLAKRLKQGEPGASGSYQQEGGPFDQELAGVSIPEMAESSSDSEPEDIVPAPAPSPHDPGHALRKRMRLRFREILRLDVIRSEATLVSEEPITSTEVPDSAYDAEDEEQIASESGDERDASTKGDSTVEIETHESDRAATALRDHIQMLFHPPSGAGLPAAKRKEVIQIVQLALTAGHTCPDITVLDLFPKRGGESTSGTLSSIDSQFKKHMLSLTHDDG